MSKYIFNNELVSSFQEKFNNEKNSFKNNSYAVFKNSYLSTCSESIVSKMAGSLDNNYQTISKGYNSINEYWTDYLDTSDSLEKSFLNMDASCTNSTINSYLSSFINVKTNSSSNTSMSSFKKVILNAVSKASLSYGSYKGDETDYSEKIKDIDSKKYKVSNYSDMANTDNDKGIINKTTVGADGKDISYSYKIKTDKGTVVYYDKDGNIVKRINTDGTIEIGDETYHSDGTVTNKTGSTKLNDGSYYTKYPSGNGSEIKFKDGTTVSYDNDGNVTKITKPDSTINYEYDENGNISNVNEEKSSSDGYSKTNYNQDGTYETTSTKDDVTTTTTYDKNGNVISTEKSYYDIDEDGAKHGKIVEKDGAKYTYTGSYYNKLQTKEEVNKDGSTTITHYDKDGNFSYTETTSKDGTVTTKSNNGSSVTDSDGNVKRYDENGKKTYETTSTSETTYHEDGTYTVRNNDGSSKGYYEDGTVQYESNSDSSKITWYDQDGNWVQKREIKDDGLIYDTTVDGNEMIMDSDYNVISYKDKDGNDLPHF